MTQSDQKKNPIIDIQKLEVKPTAITALIFVPVEYKMANSAPEGFEQRLRQLLPHIDEQLCTEQKDESIPITSTPTAHLFEHIVLEVLARLGFPADAPREKTIFGGFTTWDHTDLSAGGETLPYSVTVQVADDFYGIAAFSIAQELLDAAWVGEDPFSLELALTQAHASREKAIQ